MQRTILVIASLPASLANFRGPFIAAMLAAGHRVHVAAPDLSFDIATRDWLGARGAVCHDVPMSRTGLNPVTDVQTLFALWRLMRRIGPDVTLGYTIKPVIWGGIAARLARVGQSVALITGLGYAFTGQARGKRAAIQAVARGLYRLALRGNGVIFFQNPDDRDEFARLNLLPSGANVVIVNGSGVDLTQFQPAPLPPPPIRFLLIARLLGDKGLREYAKAAAALKPRYPTAEFHIVGGSDANPDAIPLDEVRQWQAAGHVIWHGALTDVRPSIAACHVYVLPSYREGTPRTVLEAMAMGRPVITTDAPGCRETVVSGENGLLVPIKDASALAAAMERFLEAPDLIGQMGDRSLRLAQDKYDVTKVNAVMMAAMGLLAQEPRVINIIGAE